MIRIGDEAVYETRSEVHSVNRGRYVDEKDAAAVRVS